MTDALWLGHHDALWHFVTQRNIDCSPLNEAKHDFVTHCNIDCSSQNDTKTDFVKRLHENAFSKFHCQNEI